MRSYKEWLADVKPVTLQTTFIYCPYIPLQMTSATVPNLASTKAIDKRTQEIQKKLDLDFTLTFEEDDPGYTHKYLQDWMNILDDTISKK